MRGRNVLFAILSLLIVSAPVFSLGAPEGPAGSDVAMHAMNVAAADMEWMPMFPEAGERSSQICILRTDAKSGAMQLMIRMPANFHVPKHWHTANETHTILSGTFVMECDGARKTLPAGSFNYVPSKMQHEAWTSPWEGAVVFITVDGPWDINWVNGPPKPADIVGGVQP